MDQASGEEALDGVLGVEVSIAGGPVAARIEGLTPQTTYYFRVVARNVAGSSTGQVISFATPVAADVERPLLGGLSLTRKRFSVGSASSR